MENERYNTFSHHHHNPETLFVNLQMQTILKLSFCKSGLGTICLSHTKLSSSRERHTHTYTIAQRETQRERDHSVGHYKKKKKGSRCGFGGGMTKACSLRSAACAFSSSFIGSHWC
jgi:hypothetical protein